MRIIGITGAVGSGKSTVSGILKDEYNACVIDADNIARQVVEPGEPAYNSILERFGREVLNRDKTINRKVLGEIVFKNPDKLAMLDKLTHPVIAGRIEEKLNRVMSEGWKLIVIEAPIPIKVGFQNLVNEIWLIYADKELRAKRIMNRNFVTRKEAMMRIEAQDSKLYNGIAHIEINNSFSLEELKKIVGEILG